jgi:hypothetical protein
MRRHKVLRPQMFADEVRLVVLEAMMDRRVLDVGVEARRISDLSGCSFSTVLSNLVEAGDRAGISMSIPGLRPTEATFDSQGPKGPLFAPVAAG